MGTARKQDFSFFFFFTRVEVNSGLSDDELRGHGRIGAPPVEQLGDLQQPTGLISPVKEAVQEKEHRQGCGGLPSCYGSPQKSLSVQFAYSRTVCDPESNYNPP